MEPFCLRAIKEIKATSQARKEADAILSLNRRLSGGQQDRRRRIDSRGNLLAPSVGRDASVSHLKPSRPPLSNAELRLVRSSTATLVLSRSGRPASNSGAHEGGNRFAFVAQVAEHAVCVIAGLPPETRSRLPALIRSQNSQHGVSPSLGSEGLPFGMSRGTTAHATGGLHLGTRAAASANPSQPRPQILAG